MFLDTGAPIRCSKGRFHSPLPLIERFAQKCRFEPSTGCVVWIGGTSAGRGNTTHYGVFWDADEKRRWFAHRWAAMHIHRLDLTSGLTVGHVCPHTRDGHPNSLCVEHVALQTLGYNVAERNTRIAKTIRAEQSLMQRQFWLFVERGFEIAPPVTAGPRPDDIPFFEPPAWFRPFMQGVDRHGDECPF